MKSNNDVIDQFRSRDIVTGKKGTNELNKAYVSKHELDDIFANDYLFDGYEIE
jgi:hypothetical protein